MFRNDLTNSMDVFFCESSGKTESFEDLYIKHRLSIYRFIVSHGVSAEIAQDLTQEVFLRRLRAAHSKAQIDSEQAWLVGVAAKVTVDHWRSLGKPHWVSMDSPGIHPGVWVSSGPNPEQVFGEHQKSERVADAMSRLPFEQRIAIELRIKGLPYREIGGALGVSTSTVATWLSTAVESLRKVAHE